jgi:hypothetical protein
MIVSLCGLIGSGKGTVSDILSEQHGFVKVSWADSLKDVLAAAFVWDRAMLEGNTVESRAWREQVDVWWASRLEIPHFTPRFAMQTWGTALVRDQFHTDTWVASLEKKLSDVSKNYVVADTRFLNELESLQKLDAKFWRVKRGQDPQWFEEYVQHNIPPENIHPSEWQWARYNFDQIIDNNSTIHSLGEKVRALIT